jgi:hypothetical protein
MEFTGSFAFFALQLAILKNHPADNSLTFADESIKISFRKLK